MEILDWSSFGQLMNQHTLNLAISTVSNQKPISMFTKLNRFKSRMTRRSNEQTRIALGWHHVKSNWFFTTRAISLLNNCPKNILTTKCKKKMKEAIKAHIRQTTSTSLDWTGRPIGIKRSRGTRELLGTKRGVSYLREI